MTAACGQPQQVLQSGAHGREAQTGDILIRGLRVQGPEGPRLESGTDAPVWLRLLSERGTDTLLAVSSGTAARVEIRWDRACDGTAEVVEHLPLTDEGSRFADAYHLRIVDLNRDVPVGMSIPLTFDFATAPTITMDVPVVPTTEVSVYPSVACAAG
ncbi:hypothetical protein [Catenuloplanes indicus]|uniref:Uncharacterized protein n=1 Tax=Catenuloplanes indicus TaxID=137267 RepID=A0AAE3VY55_9ACTN|nr:hypothetical protein [Catenuloplanes indicus]MDQ0365140.1 hypothetical protein [Catenuloplanes indicus]